MNVVVGLNLIQVPEMLIRHPADQQDLTFAFLCNNHLKRLVSAWAVYTRNRNIQ